MDQLEVTVARIEKEVKDLADFHPQALLFGNFGLTLL